jgi:hypothetical protein
LESGVRISEEVSTKGAQHDIYLYHYVNHRERNPNGRDGIRATQSGQNCDSV